MFMNIEEKVNKLMVLKSQEYMACFPHSPQSYEAAIWMNQLEARMVGGVLKAGTPFVRYIPASVRTLSPRTTSY
jgi:hypothetical protein